MKSKLENIIKYAVRSKLLVIPDIGTGADIFSIEKLAQRGLMPLTVRSTDGAERTFDVDFASDLTDSAFLKYLRAALPIVEVIDLIDFAIDCRVVDDESRGRLFKSYEGDYTALSKAKDIFEFSIRDGRLTTESKYRITFNKSLHDPRKKIEYATRSSQFVDSLVRRVMTRYNILLVHKATLDSTVNFPELPLGAGCEICETRTQDAESETNTIQSHVKVLIRYRDTAENKSFTENVIDDIYVTINNDGTLSFDFFNIVPGKSEPKLGVLRGIPVEELANIKKIKDYVEARETKYTIFDKLRENEDSNLHKLLSERMQVYKKEARLPKVEFTVTPLSIYSNHIIERTITYVIKSRNTHPAFHDVKVEYNKSYDPTETDDIVYDFMGRTVTAQDPLVVVATNNFVTDGNVIAKLAFASETVNLNEENPDYYGNDYQNVYFARDAVRYIGADRRVLLEEPTATPANKGGSKKKSAENTPRELPYLLSDIKKSEITGKYYHKSELVEMKPVRILKVRARLKGAEPPSDMLYIEAQNVRSCRRCNAKWGAGEDEWAEFERTHKVEHSLDMKIPYCCPACINSNTEGERAIVLRDVMGGYYADDVNGLRHTALCPLCKGDKNRGFIFTGDKSKLSSCSVCGRFHCSEHLIKQGNRAVCRLCAGIADGARYSSFADAAGHSTQEAQDVWERISSGLGVFDKNKMRARYNVSGMETRVRIEGKRAAKLYYFVGNEKKIYVLKKIAKIKKRS